MTPGRPGSPAGTFHPYIDPGSGGLPYAIGPWWAWLAGFLALLISQVKRLLAFLRSGWPGKPGFSRGKTIALVAVLVLSCFAMYYYWMQRRFPKAILLGMDGLDPKVLERLTASGDLPNFTKLMRMGGYRRLATVVPSESPVAWTTLATGSNPGKHGVLGFIQRDPKTYMPFLALYRSGSSIQSVRKAPAFWQLLSEKKVPVSVIRFPLTFPPEAVHGRMLSGMGVPDLQGSLGRFSYYTADRATYDRLAAAGRKGTLVLLEAQAGGAYRTTLLGPKAPDGAEPKESTLPLDIVCQDRSATLKVGDASLQLKEKQWSEWVRLQFSLSLLKKVSGICRFYLESAHPLKLYLSPIEMDPKDPPFPISYPQSFASDIAKEIGDFHTLGMPDDTNAFVGGVIDEGVFLEHSERILREREAMLDLELARFREGLLAFVFDQPDRTQHVFWKEGREKPVEDCYRRLDGILGRLLDKIDDRTLLLLVSDHGFAAFKWNLHLNRWLQENGYLALRAGRTESREFFEGVDWTATRAYAVGLNGIYLNLAGRERHGRVTKEESRALKEKLKQDLLELKGTDGRRVVRRVFFSDEIYHGPALDSAPDLLLGLEEGTRISEKTALGATGTEVFEENRKQWSGDHVATDPDLVPGVLLSNRKIATEFPRLQDLAPTLLEVFGCPIPEDMDGAPLSLLRK